jgi:CHAT domain-containing protein
MVNEEIQTSASIFTSASAAIVNDIHTSPTVDMVVDQIPTAHILHLACHGHQDSDPLKSHFALTDGSLTISTLMKLDLQRAMLAFLSACDTAKGDKDQPDQAVHLAASMLFCGFRSVVATMW